MNSTAPGGQAVKQHVFAQVPAADIQRSSFDRSHGLKTTLNAMQIMPILVDEALPGDTFNVQATLLARLATPLKPIMDNLFLDTFFFAVPYRLVWEHWEQFNGMQVDPGDSTAFTIPQLVAPSGGFLSQSLADFFGLPTLVAGISVSALHFRAHNLIYNDWFRDQNLQNSVTVEVDDGPDTLANYAVYNRGKRHDYFTSCLPWPQKGAAVSIPLGVSAPVSGTFALPAQSGSTGATELYDQTAGNSFIAKLTNISAPFTIQGSPTGGASGDNVIVGTAGVTIPSGTVADVTVGGTGLIANLSAATAATINSLRQAFQIQKLLERDARGGTRYTEVVRAHFGVTSPDARLQRPEYLGGASQRINITPVAQTSVSAATPQGNLAAYGTAVSRGNGFSKSFTEHCLILGYCSVRADLTYQQGLNRMWSRSTRYDFYWPALSHLGEQAVLNKEIYAQGTAGGGADAATFGYQERYGEYRYKPSQVCGQFRSNFATPLDFWHLADYYTSLPTLGATWISAAPPMARIEAVTNEVDFLLDVHFSMKCARPMPVYGVPGLIDHF